MRLDKFLADMQIGSRREVKAYIKKGWITVNQQVIKSDKFQVAEETDQVMFAGEPVKYQKYFYYLLNKPAGVISATKDEREETVLDLLKPADHRGDLFPVGRLDKDTEGLLILTNDGELTHRLLSPKHHVEKEYFAKVAGVMTAADVAQFATGLTLDQKKTLPAQLTIVATDLQEGTSEIRLILQEGRFHQVKRMVKAVGKEVTYLQRLRMGALKLDESLPLGAYRPLTAAELALLQQPTIS